MAKAKQRTYTAGNGKVYPLHEAEHKFPIEVYKKDCPKAVVSDPEQCLIALGALRDKTVEAVYIGTGKDAYVCFKATRYRPAHAVHFTLNTKAAKVRDYFDTHKGVMTKQVVLSAPTAGRTHDHRAVLNKRRRAEIKAGAPVRKQDKPRVKREDRTGIPYRRKAKIGKGGNVIAFPAEADAA
jgi:hypothetical protein